MSKLKKFEDTPAGQRTESSGMRSICRVACVAVLGMHAFSTEAEGALLIYYPFDGNSNDATGNAGEAILNNGAFINPAGRFGGALDLSPGNAGGAPTGNASNAIVAAGTHLDSAFTNNAFAVSFHQYNFSFEVSSAFWLHSPSATGGERGAQAHTPWFDGTVYFDQSGCCMSPSQRLTSGGAVLRQWQHFVFQRDSAGTMEIWIDGVLQASSSGAEPVDAFNGVITIGSEGLTGSQGFDGLIDDFAVFDQALTREEIQFLSTNSIPEPGSALLALLGVGMVWRRHRC